MRQYIVSNPNILDGEPVIAGTRIPVIEVLLFIKEGYPLAEIQKMFPHVTLHTFERVIEEVAVDITTHPSQHVA
jgi:uncharacterized protein (DUF433 family)